MKVECGVIICAENLIFNVVECHYLWRILNGSNEKSVVIESEQ